MPDFGQAEGVTIGRSNDRDALLTRLDELRRGLDQREHAGSLAKWDAYQRQAFRFALTCMVARNGVRHFSRFGA